eukprot:COSAG02_NODE_364_length_23758_cov_17.250011_10_plen_129_part_00
MQNCGVYNWVPVQVSQSSTARELTAQWSLIAEQAQARHYVAVACAVRLVYGVWCRLNAPSPFRRDAVGQARATRPSEAAVVGWARAWAWHARDTSTGLLRAVQTDASHRSPPMQPRVSVSCQVDVLPK